MDENSIYIGGMEERCIAVPDIALDANNVEDVVTVVGGPVLVTVMLLEITEAVSNHACAMGWVSDPTSGTGTTDIATSTADIDQAAIGDFFYAELDGTTPVKAAPGSALPLAGVSGVQSGMVVPVGGIDFTFANANPTSGIGTLFMRYKPLAPGAKIVG